MMTRIEGDLHLFQPPLYHVQGGASWYGSYKDALATQGKSLTWDLAAILSILSFGYACGDRTLVNEIKRKPWLSSIDSKGEIVLSSIPPHDRKWQSYQRIAENLERLLLKEALEACQGHNEIYVLLSGGLDSRVTAGILAKLFREDKLPSKPIAVTWGLPDSRDVVFGRETAKILGFDWIYINHKHEFLLRNIDAAATDLGCLVSPLHLHAMLWFEKVSKNAIVFASSYGDMVGRAEFAKKHLLELDHLKPVNRFGLLLPDILNYANNQFILDLKQLHNRTPQQPKYVLCDHEMHCNYTRGMLAQAMNIINTFCNVYQMFTHPNTYSYMWSIHPSLRFDDIYAELLNLLDPRLLSLPWARTNQALHGKATKIESGLNPEFHAYSDWISGPVYDAVENLVDIDWFESTGIFRSEKIRALYQRVRRKDADPRCYDTFLWLASFRRFADLCAFRDIQVQLPKFDVHASIETSKVPELEISSLRQYLSRSVALQKIVKSIRRPFLRFQARLLYPPVVG